MSKHLARPVEPQKACVSTGFLIAYLFVIVPDFSRKSMLRCFLYSLRKPTFSSWIKASAAGESGRFLR